MKLGVVVPAFRDDPAGAIELAVAADETGLDGVFVMDHLWPMGQPDRPALSAFPLLGAIATATWRVAVGSLVARIGLVPDAVLVSQFATLRRMAGDRVIAGLGAGDRLSFEENTAYDVPVESAGDRLASVEVVATELLSEGTAVWVGGRSPEVRQVCRRTGAVLNVWGVSESVFAEEAEAVRRGAGATWAGQVLLRAEQADANARAALRPDQASLLAGTPTSVAERLLGFERAGASWAVCSPVDPDPELVSLLNELRRLVA